jgi:hypothetical protein
MTDRLNGVWVAFEKDIRDDDAESLIEAIKHLRGVLAVEAKVSDSTDWIAQQRARDEWRKKLVDILWPKP